jgi:hypothetical protein
MRADHHEHPAAAVVASSMVAVGILPFLLPIYRAEPPPEIG